MMILSIIIIITMNNNSQKGYIRLKLISVLAPRLSTLQGFPCSKAFHAVRVLRGPLSAEHYYY